MKAYLVDFENVKSHGLKGITRLGADDQVIIFYSVNSNTLSFEMHQQVMQSNARIEYYDVKVGGKNALDFQLSSMLGFLIGSGNYTHVYIISGDKGFDRLHDFWTGGYVKHKTAYVFRTSTIDAAVKYTQSAKPNKTVEINRGISNISDEEAEQNAKDMQIESSKPMFEEIDISSVSAYDKSFEKSDEQVGQEQEIEQPDNAVSLKEAIDEPLEDLYKDDEDLDDLEDSLKVNEIFSESLYESIDELPNTENMTNQEIQQGFEKYEGKIEHNFEQADEEFSEVTKAEQPQKPKAKKQTVKRTKKTEVSKENKQPKPKGRPRKNPKQDKSKEFENLFPENNQPQYDELAGLVNDICSMTEIKKVQALIQTMPTKQKFYHATMRLLGQKKGLEVYSKIKKSYADIKAIK